MQATWRLRQADKLRDTASKGEDSGKGSERQGHSQGLPGACHQRLPQPRCICATKGINGEFPFYCSTLGVDDIVRSVFGLKSGSPHACSDTMAPNLSSILWLSRRCQHWASWKGLK